MAFTHFQGGRGTERVLQECLFDDCGIAVSPCRIAGLLNNVDMVVSTPFPIFLKTVVVTANSTSIVVGTP